MYNFAKKTLYVLSSTIFISQLPLQAASETWLGTSESQVLSDPNNWTNTTLPSGNSDVGTFDTSTSTSPTLTTNLTIGNFSFPATADSYTFTLNGGDLTVPAANGGIVNDSPNAQVFNLNTSSTLSIESSSPNSINVQTNLTDSTLSLTGSSSSVVMDVSADGTSSIALGTNTLIMGSNNLDFAIASPITGSGNITKIGTGTYDLTAATGDSWSTTISEGTVDINNGGNLGSGTIFFEPTTTSSFESTLQVVGSNPIIVNSIQIGDGFTAILQAPNEMTLNGPITDVSSGGNIDFNSGTIYLGNSNGNTYSGTTTIDTGVLLIANGDNVTSPNSPMIINGEFENFNSSGYNNSIFSLSGSGILAVGDGSKLNIVGDTSTLYSGTIIDQGNLNLEGGGTLELTGNSSSSATTNVKNGSQLILNGKLGQSINVSDGGILSGTGTSLNTQINAGGTISPGNSMGTFNTYGFQQSPDSTYLVEIDLAGQSDLINVIDNATLIGGEVVVVPVDGINLENSYQILSTGFGVSGRFDGVSLLNPKPGIIPFLNYSDPNSVFLEFQRIFLSGAISRNEAQVQAQLNQLLLGDLDEDESTLLLSLFGLSPSELTETLDQLSGAQYASDPLIVGILGRQFVRRLYDPVRLLVVDPCYSPDCDGITFWAQGGWGRNLLRNNGNGFGFNSSGGNVTIGVQKTFIDIITTGIGLSYDYESIHYNLNGNGRMNSAFLGLYGLYRPENFYLLADAAFGYSENKVHRSFAVGSDLADANSRPIYYDFTAYLEFGIDLPVWNLMIQPFVGIESNSYSRKGFTERNAGDLGLFVHQRDRTSATSRAGLHLTTKEDLWGFFLSADMAWDCRLTTVDNNQSENFIGFGNPFIINGVPVSRSSFDGAITLSNHITEYLRSYIEAEAEVWNKSASYNFQLGLLYTY